MKGGANSINQSRVLCINLAPLIACARACAVINHFTSLKTKIVTAVLAVEAAQLIQTAVAFSLRKDKL